MSKVNVAYLIDDASEGKGDVAIELWVESTQEWVEYPSAIGVDSGSLVRLTPSAFDEDDRFVGWFIGGVCVNTDDPYEIELTENLAFVVKFGGTATVKKAARLGEPIPAVLENAAAGVCDPLLSVHTHAATYEFVYGDPVWLEAVGGTNANFSGWYDMYLAGEQSLQRIDLTASHKNFVPTESFEITAVFSRSPMEYYIHMTNSGAAFGALHFSTAEADVVEITDVEYYAALNNRYGDRQPGGSIPLPQIEEVYNANDRYIKLFGPDACTIKTRLLSDVTFQKWKIAQINPVSDGGWTRSDPVDLSVTQDTSLNVASDCVIYALYNSPDASSVQAGYCTGSNSAMGVLSLSPVASVSSSGTVVSGEYFQGAPVTAIARALNGYKFAAWHYNEEGTSLASTNAEFAFTIESGGTTTLLFAQFVQDDDAIYEWEGDTAAGKELEWRSRRYTSPIPFNPTCGRIMADGYPATLVVQMSSSPDAPTETTRQVTIALPSQNGVRLPIVRPEKYIEVTVKSLHPVLHAAISTSMEGLADE